MAYADYRHRLSLRVRWAEVDMQGVVFNGHYLTYCDVCITEYWRATGLRYPDDFLARGSDLFVRKASPRYDAAAVYDDELEICGRTARIGRSSLRFVIEMFRRGQHAEPLVDAELVYVNADPVSKTALPWPEDLRTILHDFETVKPEQAHG
jgi:acyl-CoA thioester hydrolase